MNLIEDDSLTYTKDELLCNKYSLAGSCVRWLGITKATKDIDYHLAKVYSVQDYVQHLPGRKNIRAVNHMLSSFEEHGKVIISEYVTRQLVLKCELSLITGILNCDFIKKNPVFHGWVLEMYFLSYLRTASNAGKCVKVHNLSNQPEEWWCEVFEPTALKGKLLPNVEWLIPKKWNQGCYDCVQLKREEKLLRVVHVTRAQSHGFML